MIKGFFKSIYRGIVNLIVWFPVIWSDRNWDQYYFYKIIKCKLEKMEKLQRLHGISVNSKDYAKQIKLCIYLLNRILDDGYLENALRPHEKKWGESKFTYKPYPEDDSLIEVDITVEKAITEEEIKQENKEKSRLYKHSDNMRKQDLNLLFRNLNKYGEGWWD